MTLQETLLTNPILESRKNVFYQKNIEVANSFERNYINLRRAEGRLYSDDEVKHLPDYDGNSKLSKEWSIRKHSAKRLIHLLQSKGHNKLLLELGCGNGWLTNLISTSLVAQVVGLDINETELTQGSRVFQNSSIAFIYGDIFSIEFPEELFDSIILASALQYFNDLNKLISHLLKLLKPGGEIHILDTPFYESINEREQAKIRTKNYFEQIGHSQSDVTYCHHLWDALKPFQPDLIYDPRTLSSKLTRKFASGTSPFPYFIIQKPR